nr:MAG TPA: hypothetical protein [Bacteriophage sp.]
MQLPFKCGTIISRKRKQKRTDQPKTEYEGRT